MRVLPEPVGVSDAARLRDAVISLLDEKLAEWSGRVVARRMIPLAKFDLPSILVHVSSERFDGYLKAVSGVPDYTVSTDLTVAIAMNAGSDPELDEKLDEASDRVLYAIMTDADFMASIEGVTRITRDFQTPRIAETLLGVMTLIFTIQNSAAFEPVINDSFGGVNVDLVSPSGGEHALYTFNTEGN